MRFIELIDDYGRKHLMNLLYIQEVVADDDEHCTIYFAFNQPNAYEQDHIKVNLPYERVVSTIRKAVRNNG